MKRKTNNWWTRCCSLKRRVARLSDQLPVAYGLARLGSLKRHVSRTYWACSLRARSSERSSVMSKSFGFQPLFTQNPKFWSFKCPNSSQKMFTGLIHKKALKDTQNLKLKHYFIIIQQFNQLHQTFNNNDNSHHQFTIMNTQCINSSTTHPETKTTTYNHEIIHNSTTTTSFFINFTQTQNIPTCIHLGMQIQHQQHNYHSIHIHEHIIKT